MSTHEKLRQERANLWRAKYLNRKLTGDASWIPAGKVESPEDWELFEPRHRWEARQPSRKRKRHRAEPPPQNGSLGQSSAARTEPNGVSKRIAEVEPDQPLTKTNGTGDAGKLERDQTAVLNGQTANGDLTKSQKVAVTIEDGASKSADASLKDAMMEGAFDLPVKTQINGVEAGSVKQNGPASDRNHSAHPQSQENDPFAHLESTGEKVQDAAEQVPHAASNGDDGSPPPSTTYHESPSS